MRARKRASEGRRAGWPLALPLLALLVTAALCLGLGALWLTAVLLLLLLMSDLAVFAYCLRRVEVLQTLSADECVTGERLTLTYEVRAPGALALCPLERRMSGQSFFEGRAPVLRWQPLEALRGTADLRAADVGLQRAGMSALRLFSPLGVFAVPLRLDRPRREGPRAVLVLPRLDPTTQPPFSVRSDLGARDRRAPDAGDFDSVSGSREYQEGEPLSRVNWKLTAARRELYLKEYDSVGLRRDSSLYVAPFSRVLRQRALEGALAGGALLLRDNDLCLWHGESRAVIRKGDLAGLARALARLPDRAAAPEEQNDALCALAAERSCCAVLTDGDEEGCRLLGKLPRGSLVFALGAPAWRQSALRVCRGAGVNLCVERTGEEWQWLRS